MKRTLPALALVLLAACGGELEAVDAGADAQLDAVLVDAQVDAGGIDAPSPAWRGTWTCVSGCSPSTPKPMIAHNTRLAPLPSPGLIGECVYWFGCEECPAWTCGGRPAVECIESNCGTWLRGSTWENAGGFSGTSSVCFRQDGTVDGTFSCVGPTNQATTWTFAGVAE